MLVWWISRYEQLHQHQFLVRSFLWVEIKCVALTWTISNLLKRQTNLIKQIECFILVKKRMIIDILHYIQIQLMRNQAHLSQLQLEFSRHIFGSFSQLASAYCFHFHLLLRGICSLVLWDAVLCFDFEKRSVFCKLWKFIARPTKGLNSKTWKTLIVSCWK